MEGFECKKAIKKINNIFLIGIFMTMFSSISYASAGKIMAEILQLNQTIQSNITTKDKLEKYKTISTKIDEIVETNPGSDIALKILSNQSIGDFNPATIQKDYVALLTEYYDKVCEVSPSYKCLGFVSLSAGFNACSTATNYRLLKSAHQDLANSIRIFVTQDKEEDYTDLAVVMYKSCTSRSQLDISTWDRDYFSNKLVQIFIAEKKVKKARAIIESLTTPYFKLYSILSLKGQSNKNPDRKYFNRLKRYIDEKMPVGRALSVNEYWAKDRGQDYSFDRLLSKLELMNFFMKNSSEEITLDDIDSVIKMNNYYYRSNNERNRFLAQSILNLQFNMYSLPADRRNFNLDSPKTRDFLFNVSDLHKVDFWKIMITLHGMLLMQDDGLQLATKFKAMILETPYDKASMFDLYASLSIQTKISAIEAGKFFSSEASPKQLSYFLKDTNFIYSIFKKMVDFEQVCQASKILFQDLMGGPQHQDAIKYIANSLANSKNTKYSCGDEDLELLL